MKQGNSFQFSSHLCIDYSFSNKGIVSFDNTSQINGNHYSLSLEVKQFGPLFWVRCTINTVMCFPPVFLLFGPGIIFSMLSHQAMPIYENEENNSLEYAVCKVWKCRMSYVYVPLRLNSGIPSVDGGS